jgi:hypothetical protein
LTAVEAAQQVSVSGRVVVFIGGFIFVYLVLVIG